MWWRRRGWTGRARRACSCASACRWGRPASWNLVEQPLAFLHDPALWPLSLFQPAATAENMGLLFASAAIAAVPAVLVFLMGKDHLAAGIAATTRKDA